MCLNSWVNIEIVPEFAFSLFEARLKFDNALLTIIALWRLGHFTVLIVFVIRIVAKVNCCAGSVGFVGRPVRQFFLVVNLLYQIL